MTNEEYMKQIIHEWNNIDDDLDFFDEISGFFEEMLEDDE